MVKSKSLYAVAVEAPCPPVASSVSGCIVVAASAPRIAVVTFWFFVVVGMSVRSGRRSAAAASAGSADQATMSQPTSQATWQPTWQPGVGTVVADETALSYTCHAWLTQMSYEHMKK